MLVRLLLCLITGFRLLPAVRRQESRPKETVTDFSVMYILGPLELQIPCVLGIARPYLLLGFWGFHYPPPPHPPLPPVGYEFAKIGEQCNAISPTSPRYSRVISVLCKKNKSITFAAT